MKDQRGTFRSGDLELLKLLEDADSKSDTSVPFEYLPLNRWRFGWLLHPGIDGGTCVVDSDAFDRLVAAAFVRITDEDLSMPSYKAVLTEKGRRHLDDSEDAASDEPEDGFDTLCHHPAGSGWSSHP